MGLNLSRGETIKYYSSDRITQIIGNGLVTLIDEKTEYNRFFNNNEMVFYKNINDLSEKIIKISKDEKLRKKIGKNGKIKYQKYFNSTIVENYIIEIVFATRNPSLVKLDDLTNYISFGASPRASINLSLAAKANAFFNNRDYVTPDDIKEIAYDVLNHRIILNYEAEAEGITSQEIIKKILDTIEINS